MWNTRGSGLPAEKGRMLLKETWLFLLCKEREKERNEWGCNQKYLLWAGETVKMCKVFAAKPDNLSSVHETHTVERENQLLQAVF